MKIEIKEIDLEDSTFTYTFPININEMRESIKRIGLLNPVILFKRNSGYKIISGIKRVLACRSLGFDSIDSVVYEGGSISEKEAFMTAVFDNTAIRELNCIEKSTVLCKLRYNYNMNDEEIINDIMPILKLKQSGKLLDDYCSLKDIGEGLKRHIIEREIPIKVSSVLASVSHEKLLLLSEIIISLNLGTNKIKEFISLIDEITQRDVIGIKKLYSNFDINVIIKNEKITPSQKWEKIIGLLRRKRFPIWNEIKKKLNRNVSSLNLPQNMSLHYPPYLEGDKFKIEIEFSKHDELKRSGQQLIDISNKKELSEIIELI